jgi:Repeat of Unknown Function (DUF347)
VLLPAGLIIVIVIGWRLGANPVLSFWLAYILTRPLGANLGDWFASPRASHGLGFGTALTSAIFLTTILATVVYLTRSRRDVIEDYDRTHTPTVTTTARRERIMLGYYAAVAVATGAVLVSAAGDHHATAANNDDHETTSAPLTTQPPVGQTSAQLPPGETAKFRTIAEDTLAKVRAGDQSGATARIKDLETAWDNDESTLQPLNETAWHVLDGQIDSVLKALRTSKPDPATEIRTLIRLLRTLQ